MEIWFSENHTDDVKLSIRVDRQLYSVQSDYQRIDVFDSKEFGRVLTLDGYVMMTERDEFIFHEMLVHVPMAVHPNVRKVLIIGGGDGGVVRELSHYPEIESIDLVELDPLLVEVCKKYLPNTSCRMDEKRLHLYCTDALRFVRSKENEYDLIIVDSTDPFGPGEILFTKEFYGNCYKALNEDGIMIHHNESPFYMEEAAWCQRIHKRVCDIFEESAVYQAHLPTYPSGHWLFGFASKKYHPLNDLAPEKWNMRGIYTRYYTTRLHQGAFALPAYVEEMLREVEEY